MLLLDVYGMLELHTFTVDVRSFAVTAVLDP